MKTTAILILENIWWDLNQNNSSQASVLPYFEGLCRSNEDVQIYYITFTDAKSFEKSLKHLMTAPQKRLFIYVASHGYGARLGNANFSNISMIMGLAIQLDKKKRVEGVIWGACEIGGVHNDLSLEMLHWRTGIAWLFAYKNIMSWMPSTLIDLNMLHTMLRLNRQNLCNRQQIVNCAASALSLFNPIENIGWSRSAYKSGQSADITVKDAIRFLVKPRGSGNVFQDDTQLLIDTAYSRTR